MTATREQVIRDYYRGFADVFVEVVHSLRLSPGELARRVTLKNDEAVREEFARGKPVIVLAAHQCNWEWLLLGLSQLGVPVDAAYKPLLDSWAETRDAQAPIRVRCANDPGAGVVRRHHQAARHAAHDRHPRRPGAEGALSASTG